MASSSNYIKKVAIVGVSGNSGAYMVSSLLAAGKHTISAITRKDSNSKLPDGVEAKRVDYDDESSLVEALRGQDALVITMGTQAPPEQEMKLIRAAAAADVPWVLPNAWAPDFADESISKDVFLGHQAKDARDLIEKLGKSSWISMATSFWYEWSLSFPDGYGINIPNKTAVLFDDGLTPITTSTWPQVGRAVASLLSLKIMPDGSDDKGVCLDKYRNKFVYTSSFTITQKDMLDSCMRVTKTSTSDWKVSYEPAKERYARGAELFTNGDFSGFILALYSRIFFKNGGGNVEETRGLQNDVLGLPKEDLDEATDAAIKRIESM